VPSGTWLVTAARLHRKENSVHHQIMLHSVVGASLHRRRLLHATDFFPAARFTVRGGVSVMAENSRNSPNKVEDQPLVRPQFLRQWLTLKGVELC